MTSESPRRRHSRRRSSRRSRSRSTDINNDFSRSASSATNTSQISIWEEDDSSLFNMSPIDSLVFLSSSSVQDRSKSDDLIKSLFAESPNIVGTVLIRHEGVEESQSQA